MNTAFIAHLFSVEKIQWYQKDNDKKHLQVIKNPPAALTEEKVWIKKSKQKIKKRFFTQFFFQKLTVINFVEVAIETTEECMNES